MAVMINGLIVSTAAAASTTEVAGEAVDGTSLAQPVATTNASALAMRTAESSREMGRDMVVLLGSTFSAITRRGGRRSRRGGGGRGRAPGGIGRSRGPRSFAGPSRG